MNFDISKSRCHEIPRDRFGQFNDVISFWWSEQEDYDNQWNFDKNMSIFIVNTVPAGRLAPSNI